MKQILTESFLYTKQIILLALNFKMNGILFDWLWKMSSFIYQIQNTVLSDVKWEKQKVKLITRKHYTLEQITKRMSKTYTLKIFFSFNETDECFCLKRYTSQHMLAISKILFTLHRNDTIGTFYSKEKLLCFIVSIRHK